MRTHESICLGIPEILLPKAGTDLAKWAVIACDQYTSEPEYWRKAASFVGKAPSTLNLIYPEVFLNEPNPEARIASIRDTMNRYLAQGLFLESEGFVYVERRIGGRTRKGLAACLDLEHYDFHKGATSLIRATEGTIMERIPPRVRIREGAPIEIPHIMVLVDDPDNTVIGPLAAEKTKLRKLYDFELMFGSGHLAGYQVDDAGLERGILNGLKALADPAAFASKYGLKPGTPVLLYAMGDGNHSFATAKTIWDKVKDAATDKKALRSSPLRYALVELVNLHDEALVFESIHRVLFDLAPGLDPVEEMAKAHPGRCHLIPAGSLEAMKAGVDGQRSGSHKIGLISDSGFRIVEIEKPDSNLPVGTLQGCLDAFLRKTGSGAIDYVHGTDSVVQLGRKPGNLGFYLPAMKKEELFRTVILDGALPRKTFSLGEAREKRFYMEARKLI
jgi:hypothetical protein